VRPEAINAGIINKHVDRAGFMAAGSLAINESIEINMMRRPLIETTSGRRAISHAPPPLVVSYLLLLYIGLRM
jgi:hypothetical protein